MSKENDLQESCCVELFLLTLHVCDKCSAMCYQCYVYAFRSLNTLTKPYSADSRYVAQAINLRN